MFCPTLAPRPSVSESAPRGGWPTLTSTSWRSVFQKAWVSESVARHELNLAESGGTKASTTLRCSMSVCSR